MKSAKAWLVFAWTEDGREVVSVITGRNQSEARVQFEEYAETGEDFQIQNVERYRPQYDNLDAGF